MAVRVAKTKKDVEKELADMTEDRDKWRKMYFDLARQIKEDVKSTEWYLATVSELEEERRRLSYLKSSIDKKEEELKKRQEKYTDSDPETIKRGRPSVISDETRQRIHELYKILDEKGRRKYSMQAISVATGVSKSHVAEILKQPELPGRWYFVDKETKEVHYFTDFEKAMASGQEIHFRVTNNYPQEY